MKKVSKKDSFRKVFRSLIPAFCAVVLLCVPQTSRADFNDEDRNKSTFEIGYNARTFEYVKESGNYGISYTFLPWKIAGRLYVGMHLSPFNFNYGLVDTDLASDDIRLGPALGVYFTNNIFVAMPVAVNCNVFFKGGSESTLSWGLSWSPTLYLGKQVGFYAGPLFSIGFEGEQKVKCGFRAGFYF